MTENNSFIVTNQLLEIISPNGEIFEQSSALFAEIYPDIAHHDLLWAFYQTGREKVIFAAPEDDIMELIRQLKSVASYWEADIFLGDLDDEDDSWLYEFDLPTILAHAARELHNYGLILWQWLGQDNDMYCGFLSREEDQFFIQRCGEQLTETFLQIGEEDF